MSIPSSTIIGGLSGQHKRNEADFYPTPPECTLALVGRFRGLLGRNVWEPACGDGAISEVLNSLGFDVFSTDLRHTGYGHGGVDALGTRPENIDSIVTNPPFNQAAEFILHARSSGLPFAMLLKSTYWHAASREKLFHDTGPAAVCPMLWRPNFAPERGRAPTMDVCWTVWHAHPVPSCEYVPLPKPKPSRITGDIFQ